MPAMTARVFNPLLKTFGDRLKENGKKLKEIIIAIMRKLLLQIYGVLKSGQPYDSEKRGFAGTKIFSRRFPRAMTW
jgi:transposase